ncbi:alternative ribosome rescue aminoacyl-tRNA hydrolase ArfB [Gemmatimonas sp.]|uniref:alternative ribosome rescue aminoacyl-tRNA hydrolase ArfB n=1 Tax=Gemmatimonas sp. TaxID=1962908 RepID=UPI00391983C1
MMPGPSDEALDVAPGVRIPLHEIMVQAISGGGPGGQHVNKSATRIALQWNVRTTRALREDQRERALAKLGSRLDSDGVVRIVAGEYRSQQQNRRAALERLRELVARALLVPRVRRATKPTRGSIEQRLTSKKRQGARKQERRRDFDD